MTQSEQKLTSKDILKKRYVRRLAPDESGGYVASILEFPGCLAEGDTAEEALENLNRSAESWVTVALANNQHVREPIDFDGFSGKFALRMPRSLHKQVAEFAELEGTSLNQLIVMALAHYVSGKQLLSGFESFCHSLQTQEQTKPQVNMNHLTLIFQETTPAEPLSIPLKMNFHLSNEISTSSTQEIPMELIHG